MAGACSETRAWPFSSVSRAEECQFSPGVWETHVCSFSLAEAAALPERSRGVFDCDGGFFLPGDGGGTPSFYTEESSVGLLGRHLTGRQEMRGPLATQAQHSPVGGFPVSGSSARPSALTR